MRPLATALLLLAALAGCGAPGASTSCKADCDCVKNPPDVPVPLCLGGWTCAEGTCSYVCRQPAASCE